MKTRKHLWILTLSFLAFVFAFTTSCKEEMLTDGINTITVQDIDGNTYHTVNIGTQVWMVENLNTKRYSNGDTIINSNIQKNWSSLQTGGFCNYNNDSTNYSKYGKIYNWYAVNDSRKIAPKGWHVATDADWTKLTDYLKTKLGSDSLLAKSLADSTTWESSIIKNAVGNKISINNASGLTALPGGYCDGNGAFYFVGNVSRWWSSTQHETYDVDAWSVSLSSDDSKISRNFYFKNVGFYVRCVKD